MLLKISALGGLVRRYYTCGNLITTPVSQIGITYQKNYYLFQLEISQTKFYLKYLKITLRIRLSFLIPMIL